MHKGFDVGRKDDCECWIYMIVDMILRSKLPWHSETQVDIVLEMKQTGLADPSKLFPEKELSELRYIVAYLAKLHYVDKIDYDWMVTMIRRVAKRKRCSLKPPYDWFD